PTLATPEAISWTKEGPEETSVVRLADGDLLAVSRVGSGASSPLVRSYSADNGKTWSAPRAMVAFSVAPCLRRLQSGVLALSTGRPGIFLWLATGARGDEWDSVDILAY